MDNNEQFFRVARLHADLMAVDRELQKVGRVSNEQAAIRAIALQLPIDDADAKALDAADEKLAEDRAELLRRRRGLVDRLWPDFLDLADSEVERLDAECGAGGWNDLPARCFDTLETVTLSFAQRLEDMVATWNHVGSVLTEFSQGLPVNDSTQTTPLGDSPITRLGPREQGSYAGVVIRGRSIALVSRHETLEWFLSELESELTVMMQKARTRLLAGDDDPTEVEMEAAW